VTISGRGRACGDDAERRGTWRAYYGIEDLACSLLCITQDSQGYLWFGTSGRGVLRHDGQVWTTFTMENGLADDTVNCIIEDRNGALWMATGWHGGEGKGVTRLHKGTWRTFTTADGLAHNSVTSMMEDEDGNLWLATAGVDAQRRNGHPGHSPACVRILRGGLGVPTVSVSWLFNNRRERADTARR